MALLHSLRDLVGEGDRDVEEARGLEARLVLGLRQRARDAADMAAALRTGGDCPMCLDPGLLVAAALRLEDQGHAVVEPHEEVRDVTHGYRRREGKESRTTAWFFSHGTSGASPSDVSVGWIASTGRSIAWS